jgi:hypothetical protein
MVYNCDIPLICVLKCYQLEIYIFIVYWSFFIQLGELNFLKCNFEMLHGSYKHAIHTKNISNILKTFTWVS